MVSCFISIRPNAAKDRLTVSVDGSKISNIAKLAVSNMLLKWQIFRSPAHVEACRTYYGDLSRIEGNVPRTEKDRDSELPSRGRTMSIVTIFFS
jgi:hypothetical protein